MCTLVGIDVQSIDEVAASLSNFGSALRPKALYPERDRKLR